MLEETVWQQNRGEAVPSSRNHDSSLSTTSSPSAANERALKQGCNLCSLNHWAVLIGHKHVTAELGHSSASVHIKAGSVSSVLHFCTALSTFLLLLLWFQCCSSPPFALTATKDQPVLETERLL